jgi:hypothetical protein
MSLLGSCIYVLNPDLCFLLCGLCAGRASLIPRLMPGDTLDILAKQCNSWLLGTKFRINFLRNTEIIQKNSEEFRRTLDRN